ncbi:MAG: hydroxyisourate hydrolase, partial [Chloroflexota bacterium]|nr:hydroxyisourate hydrolase [Chloroflexota bacterium]
MPGRLTTHVLDTVHGRPAAGVAIELFRIDPETDERERLASIRTNGEGRTDGPLLSGDALQTGVYELVFSLGDYFAAVGRANAAIPFLDKVPVRFGVADPDANYHIPLLASP